MDKIWKQTAGKIIENSTIFLIILLISPLVQSIKCPTRIEQFREESLNRQIRNFIDEILNVDEYTIIPGVSIQRSITNITILNREDGIGCQSSRSRRSLQDYIEQRLDDYTKTHVVSVKIPEAARLFFSQPAVADTGGKSSFMAGFGMGFLAFALKKLLLPVFIGAQLVKSVVIAMFLPSILGSFGKILGKGLSTVSGISGASAGINNHNQPVEEFDFKDTSPYNNDNNMDDDGLQDFMPAATANNAVSTTANTPVANNRFGFGNHRIQLADQQINENYYFKKPTSKKTDYKVFHKIPSSSLLLTSYDPFYSPLLSRLDAVFQQLGLGNDKSPKTELCRERLVCMMYANPAKFAPYSNLVSAQLSRELNELRKPSSDNPEILRFFRYMKAAKDGQDGEECLAHGGCPSLNVNRPSPAILTTFNDINKLVQARKFV